MLLNVVNPETPEMLTAFPQLNIFRKVLHDSNKTGTRESR